MTEILSPFSKEAKMLKAGDFYEHYRGNRYKIVALARHSETLEELVVYQALSGEGDVWVRPLSMFLETVSIDQIEKPRFRRVLP